MQPQGLLKMSTKKIKKKLYIMVKIFIKLASLRSFHIAGRHYFLLYPRVFAENLRVE